MNLSLLYISLFLTTWVFKKRMKAVALTARSSPLLSFPALWLRYQPELCSLPQLYGVSRSLPASCSILLTDHTQSDCLPERVRVCPGRTTQKTGILKQRSVFSCYDWKPKSVRSAFHQYLLSVSRQDLLMSYKVLQLKLSQEASLKWEHCLPLASRADPRYCCHQENMLYSILSQTFSGFLWMQLSTWVPSVVRGCREGLLFVPPGSCTASLALEITTHKLYSFKHCLAHYL